MHIEYRIGDVAAVSYQYASSQLASGLDGLMRKVVTACRAAVASAVSGLPDLALEGTIDLRVPRGEVRAMRAGVVRLLVEPGHRSFMGQADCHHATDHSAGVVVPQVDPVYQAVIGTPPLSVTVRSRHPSGKVPQALPSQVRGGDAEGVGHQKCRTSGERVNGRYSPS